MMTHIQAIRTLQAHAEGRVMHAGMGMCPDVLEGHESRDSECPVCQALVALALQLHGDNSLSEAQINDGNKRYGNGEFDANPFKFAALMASTLDIGETHASDNGQRGGGNLSRGH